MGYNDDANPADLAALENLTREQLYTEIVNLRLAVRSRDSLGQAKGIIRLLVRCDDDEAFDIMCRISQHTNRKMQNVAATLIDAAVHASALPPDVRAVFNPYLRAAQLPGNDNRCSPKTRQRDHYQPPS